jgi:hypothetical protein
MSPKQAHVSETGTSPNKDVARTAKTWPDKEKAPELALRGLI